MSSLVSSPDKQRCDVEDVYRDNYGLLFAIATRRFGVPEEEAPTLINDVILSYIRSAREVDNPTRWLLAAICNASRYFQRSRRRVDSHEFHGVADRSWTDHSDHGSDAVIGRLTATAILAELKQQYRDVLRMHYIEGLTAAEIAVQMETTLRYAERLIHKSLRAASEAYSRLESGETRGHEASH